jgi:hypothetical protein
MIRPWTDGTLWLRVGHGEQRRERRDMWRRDPVPTPGTGSIVFADTTADLLKVLEAAQAGRRPLGLAPGRQ